MEEVLKRSLMSDEFKIACLVDDVRDYNGKALNDISITTDSNIAGVNTQTVKIFRTWARHRLRQD